MKIKKCCANCKYWNRDYDRSHYAIQPLKTGACFMREIGEEYDEDLNDSSPVCERTDENYICEEYEFDDHISVYICN